MGESKDHGGKCESCICEVSTGDKAESYIEDTM